MKAIISFLLALVPVLSWGALCDDTYYLQSATQTILSGTNPKQLNNRQVKELQADLAGTTFFHTLMSYNVMVQFEGSCTKAVKPVIFKKKAPNQNVFSDSTDNGFYVQMYDTNTTIAGLGYKLDYWFGFYKPDTSLKYFVGRVNSESELFTSYYAAVYYTDSIRDPKSGLFPAHASAHFYSLSGPSDSASLDNGMLDGTGVRNLPADADHFGTYSIQFIKVRYGNQKPTVSIAAAKRNMSKFQTSQMGGLVLIQPGANRGSGSLSEPLSLFGMMGNKVATLHPTGYVYQWNGKTSTGAEASTGVYFVQAGNRVLGKFFYSR